MAKQKDVKVENARYEGKYVPNTGNTVVEGGEPLPSVEEQAKAAEVLDKETAKAAASDRNVWGDWVSVTVNEGHWIQYQDEDGLIRQAYPGDSVKVREREANSFKTRGQVKA